MKYGQHKRVVGKELKIDSQGLKRCGGQAGRYYRDYETVFPRESLTEAIY